ncbi:MAG: toll/interleukin-1 receptor domain-containing protein [Anaerolineales bacterium]|nr:toll/interleukin-1 receptor domain-containing protein [Anaerolineales bacterium]
MAKNIFVSYSRREIGFVDSLVDKLEDNGHQVWLDYRSLIPGTPWLDQIHKGIGAADVILLVVSKASLASQNVEVEWRSVLEQKKRIILLVFEVVDLPSELERYEWVDFRGSFKAGLLELLSQIEKPIVEEHSVPQTGFKMPGVVWIALLLSAAVAILSLPGFWTLLIPWVLIPLPYRIFKRNYNFLQVQAALIFLPITYVINAAIANWDGVGGLQETLFILGVLLGAPLAIILLFVLRSSALQRWGKEQATLPRFANPYTPNNPNPKPISFYIDHAPQDLKIAQMLATTLEKYGHPKAANMQDARTVFVMLSRFKNDSEADSEKQVVFPVIVQTTDNISPKLSKVQWIDMRGGVRRLDAIAQLLPEPEKLLKALGNRPRGAMLVLPAPVAAMQFFLTLLGVFAVGSFFKFALTLFTLNLPDLLKDSSFVVVSILFIFDLVLMLALLFKMNQALLQREGRLATFKNFTWALMGVGVLAFIQTLLGLSTDNIIIRLTGAESSASGMVTAFPTLAFIFGGIIMAVFLGVRYRDVQSWFSPSK